MAGSDIICYDGTIVRRKPVGDQVTELTFRGVRGSITVVEQCQSRFGIPGVRDVVTADRSSEFRDDEPGVVGVAFDVDIGFVSRAGTRGRRAICIDEIVQITGGSVDVIDNRLMRDWDIEDAFESLRGHPGAEAEADREGQAQTDGMEIIVDAVEVNGGIYRSGHGKGFGSEVVFAEDVAQLELAGVSGGAYLPFFGG